MLPACTVVASTDDGFAIGAAALAASIAGTAASGTVIRFVLLDSGLTSPVAHRLSQSFDRSAALAATRGAAFSAEILLPNVEALHGVRPSSQLPRASYLRILVADLLPELDRAIYLDTDTLVRTDLSPLFAFDLEGRPTGAVADGSFPTFAEAIERGGENGYRGRGFQGDLPYVNAGMLLLDLERWRADGIAKAILDDIRKHQDNYRFGDQSGINAALAGRITLLPSRWNVLRRRITNRQRIPDPAIVHFHGGVKPWNSSVWYRRAIRGYQAEWLQALRWSGWQSPAEYAAGRLSLFAKSLPELANDMLQRVR